MIHMCAKFQKTVQSWGGGLRPHQVTARGAPIWLQAIDGKSH